MTWKKNLVGGLVLLLGAAACDDLGPKEATVTDGIIQAEAALVAVDGMFQDLDVVQDPGIQELGFYGMAAGEFFAGSQGVHGSGCQAKGTGGSFSCGEMSRDGFTFKPEVTFYDGSDNVQDAFDEATTAKIHLVVDAEGNRERNFWTATIERTRDMWMTELLTDAHHLNGTGYSAVYRSRDPESGSTMTFDMEVSVTWKDVVHLQPREDHPYPESGSILRDVFVEVVRDGEVVRTRDVETEVFFNGTEYVTMVIDGEEEVQVDLAEGGVGGRFGALGGLGRGNGKGFGGKG